MLKGLGKKGVAQGGVLSPLLSHLYLTAVDQMLERAKEVTRRGPYTSLEYARFADDLVILVDAYPQHDWLLKAVETRLREELATLQLTFRTIFRSSEAILAEPPEERGRRAIHQLFQMT
jgi:RNA-directed DNA polymerase